MSNPQFPSIFKCVMRDGATYQGQDNIIRSETGGPPKSRRRYTTAYEDVTLRVLCRNQAEYQILYDFYHYTCKAILPFDWVEWRDPARRPATYSFQEVPVFTPAGRRRWYADLKLDLRTPFNGQFYIAANPITVISNEEQEVLTT